MAQAPNIDGVLIQWGDRLFYSGNRIVRGRPLPSLHGRSMSERAAMIRAQIATTVVRRAPQVMVKVTGGGRGMRAITAHFRYISKNGRLEIEDERGATTRGRDALRELADDWRFGGTLIDDVSGRREAYNVMLSMPQGTDPLAVLRAAREFARTELSSHKFVMVLHDHQANPHVHISVRAESRYGKRLNPRKADLQRWRQVFAEKLREWGIDAEATRQATRGRSENYEPLWRLKAREDQRLRSADSGSSTKSTARARVTRAQAAEAWAQIARALAASSEKADRDLARSITKFFEDMPTGRTSDRAGRATQPSVQAELRDVDQRR